VQSIATVDEILIGLRKALERQLEFFSVARAFQSGLGLGRAHEVGEQLLPVAAQLSR
jgi:hypothetical protein